MGFFDRFRKPATAAPFEFAPTLLDEFRGQPIHYDIRRLSPAEMWETQPHLRTVVSFLARNVAHLGLHSFERVGETDRRRDRESVAARLLRRPNSETTTFELIFGLVGDLALYDIAYWHVAPDSEAPSGWSVVRIPPEWVTPKNADAFRRKSYDVKAPGGDKVNFPASEILPFHGFNPTDPRDGSTPISALKGVLQEQLQSSLYRQQVWKNGGRVSAVLTRPAGVEWSDEARQRFREDWYSKYTGSGSRAGGTPILEDGMTLSKIDFSASEQQYVEGAKLSFATVCSAYHVNPTMVGLLDNANFSNVREFRRMLYGDTLGPLIAQIEDRLNTFMLPIFGMDDATHYLEFNIEEKLQGNFEEQTTALQSAVGRPWMTANEARALRNMPNIGDEGDALVTPLNVLVGGQASPRDSAPKSLAPVVLLKARATERQATKAEQVLADFFGRQSAAVLKRIAQGGDWWDGKRWNKELAADLLPLAASIAESLGKAEAARLGFSEDDYSAEQTVAFLSAVAERYAKTVNETTKAQLDAAVADDEGDPADVFAQAKESRSGGVAGLLTTFVAGFATVEAAKQIAQRNDVSPTKTWITGSNPRPEHAAMNGQTVAIDEPFSDGNDWPGGLPGCNCSVSISI